ncbi:cell envelope integrity protein CreD [Azospirillum sp. YIM B02556]|uniref:Cell envelope integrity protein CreD n=1 Tax=Azospirillum endophyticum TaxID=2800326 RepID=A0ABS1F4M6_9PROT|nr:cell envelope integrity protein CreD [Azospirillum endophyticum]MBK1838380.1 cell envelope integrity protein CreD [Azospirillum endophyticum]
MTAPPQPSTAHSPAPMRRHGVGATQIMQKLLILIVTLVAGLPISGIIEEREDRQAGLRAEFANSWGPEQVVHAPLLAIPYSDPATRSRQYLKIAPEKLSTRAALTPEQRKRGLFSATVYGAAIELTGNFAVPSRDSIETLVGRGQVIHWNESVVMLQASDLSGMAAGDRATWNGETIPWRSCAEVIGRAGDCDGALLVIRPGMPSAPAAEMTVPFQATVTLRGTGAFSQILEGRQTAAAIAAPWATPSFNGTILPSSSTVTETDFEARWQAVEYSRPLLWSSPGLPEAVSSPHGPTVSVDLLEATPIYRMISRASKYSIFFVILSFTVYTLFELLGVVRIHIVQYGLLGLSMTLFALLLISFAEPLGYAAGYWISAGLVLAQASLHTAAVTRRWGATLIFAATLAAVFGFLYVLLSLESYSLLVGSVALFLILSAVMAVTQRVDWREQAS